MFYQNHEIQSDSHDTEQLMKVMKKLQNSPELLELLKGMIK